MVPRELFLISMYVYSKRNNYLDILKIQNLGIKDIHIMIYSELNLLCVYFFLCLKSKWFCNVNR